MLDLRFVCEGMSMEAVPSLWQWKLWSFLFLLPSFFFCGPVLATLEQGNSYCSPHGFAILEALGFVRALVLEAIHPLVSKHFGIWIDWFSFRVCKSLGHPVLSLSSKYTESVEQEVFEHYLFEFTSFVTEVTPSSPTCICTKVTAPKWCE